MLPAQIKPTRGKTASSYQFILDVGVQPANPDDPIVWLNIPDITELAPTSTPTNVDVSTYANQGKQDQATLGEQFTLTFAAKMILDAQNRMIPGLELLMAAANALLDQDRAGDRVVAVRYYHYQHAQLAWEFSADVSWARKNTGNTDAEFFTFTLTAKGDRQPIANPALTAAAEKPVITSALPAGAAVGEIVKLLGTGFRQVGATITVGGVPVESASVLETAIYFTMPAGDAGAAPIVVSQDGKSSDPFDYTRG